MVLPGFAGRVRMYVMLIGYVACFKIPRFAINTLIPFVVRDMGLPTSLTPTLLAAFHPGYICSQIPGAAVVRRSGPKYLATLQLAGCAAFMAAMPWAGNIKSRGVAVASGSGVGDISISPGSEKPESPRRARRVWARVWAERLNV